MAWASAIAASLVVLIGAGLLWRASLSSPAATIRASTPRGSEAPPSAAITRPEANVLDLAITLGATRDQTRPPDLEIAQEVTAVALSIRLHSADRRASYDVAVSRADGTPVWSGNVTAPANEIKVTIPASLFAPGEYQIDVSGVDSRGTREDFGGQTVTVRGGRSKSR